MSQSFLIEGKISNRLTHVINDVRHLLTVDDRNKPIGIITPLDFTRSQGYTAEEDRGAITTVLERYMEWL